jgi:hypothetical protein
MTARHAKLPVWSIPHLDAPSLGVNEPAGWPLYTVPSL